MHFSSICNNIKNGKGNKSLWLFLSLETRNSHVVLFEFEDDKDKLFSNLGWLKEIEKYKRLSIMEDLTADQRICKTLIIIIKNVMLNAKKERKRLFL